nr:hypothetical protein GCM10025732_10630 [Glycomyces mayteni]
MCGTPAAGNVRAKTGSMTSVSALSGYATDADGRELVFSIVLNDFLYSSVKDIEDKIATAVAAHAADTTEAEIGTLASEIDTPDLEALEAEADELPAAGEMPAGLECSWYEPSTC